MAVLVKKEDTVDSRPAEPSATLQAPSAQLMTAHLPKVTRPSRYSNTRPAKEGALIISDDACFSFMTSFNPDSKLPE